MTWLRMLRWLWRTGTWWSLAVLAACGGGDGNGGTGPGGGGDLAGTYQLVGANDAAVPAVVTSPVCSPAQILSGSMKLTAGGRWEMRFDWRDDNGRQWTGDHGSYRREGDNLLLTSEAWGDRFEGEVDGEDLDLAWSR